MKKFYPKTCILLSIPVLFLTGSLFHFIYNLTGNNFAVGLFSPVNESVFEHTKMVVLPTILWWSICFLRHKKEISKNTWFFSALLSLCVSVISIPLLFYFYTQAFGIEILAIDILILFAAVTLGQLFGWHYYRYNQKTGFRQASLLMLLLLLLFAVLTITPPKIPLFQDPPTGTYGIRSQL